MSLKGYELELMQYPAFRTHKCLIRYVPPIIIVIGTIGNIASFVVLTSKCMRSNSTYFYLSVLSVADTLVLYIGLLRLWVGDLTGEDIKEIDSASCKIFSALGYFVSDYSVWVIIAVTVDRYIITCYPFRAASFCSTKRAAKVTLCLFVFFLLINSHFMWTVQGVEYRHGGHNFSRCMYTDGFQTLVDDVWPWVDAVLYAIAPFIIITVLNVLILRKVLRANSKRVALQNRCRTDSVNGVPRRNGCKPPAVSDGNKLTVMLLTITFGFLVTTLPFNLMLIATKFFIASHNENTEKLVKYNLARTVVEMLMYLNHSMNFFLYCATGQKFRQQLRCLVSRRLDSVSRPTVEYSEACLRGGNQEGMSLRVAYKNGDRLPAISEKNVLDTEV